MSSVYQPMSIIRKLFACAFGARISNTYIFFRPCHSKFMIFCAKNDILEKYLYVNHTLFILYLEGNHTLFGEKFYLIWKFISGNTDYIKESLAESLCH